MTENQQLREEYNWRLLDNAQVAIVKRAKSGVSQIEMSVLTGVSVRTIQRFESYDNLDPYLIFAYKKLL